MNDDERTEAIATRLRQLGWPAWSEMTGGWIYCVLLTDSSGGLWYFGTANTEWGGSLITEDGENLANLETPIASESNNINGIAFAIETVLMNYRAGRVTESIE